MCNQTTIPADPEAEDLADLNNEDLIDLAIRQSRVRPLCLALITAIVDRGLELDLDNALRDWDQIALARTA